MSNIVVLFNCFKSMLLCKVFKYTTFHNFSILAPAKTNPLTTMESSDNYNFSLFKPRNLHGRKNRNVILTMLLIWAVAVFGFQVLLRLIEKPTPEKTLAGFESVWSQAFANDLRSVDYKTMLNSLVLVKGKTTVSPADQKILNEAISCIIFNVIPDSIRSGIQECISNIHAARSEILEAKDQNFLDLKESILKEEKKISSSTAPYNGFIAGSLEEKIFLGSLSETFPTSLSDVSMERLPGIMKLYLIHNQSVLTDTPFLGFPFHYFYTAIFLLILFISLCIAYNILIEWRLKKEGIIEQ